MASKEGHAIIVDILLQHEARHDVYNQVCNVICIQLDYIMYTVHIYYCTRRGKLHCRLLRVLSIMSQRISSESLFHQQVLLKHTTNILNCTSTTTQCIKADLTKLRYQQGQVVYHGYKYKLDSGIEGSMRFRNPRTVVT